MTNMTKIINERQENKEITSINERNQSRIRQSFLVIVTQLRNSK